MQDYPLDTEDIVRLHAKVLRDGCMVIVTDILPFPMGLVLPFDFAGQQVFLRAVEATPLDEGKVEYLLEVVDQG